MNYSYHEEPRIYSNLQKFDNLDYLEWYDYKSTDFMFYFIDLLNRFETIILLSQKGVKF